jgi:hypothetical protein
MSALEPPAAACLERTRSVVLDIMVADGIGIAITGYLLRRPDVGALFRAPLIVEQALFGALLSVVVLSYVVLRTGTRRSLLRNPRHRAARLFRAHVLAAGIGFLAIPLGLLYGWFIDADLSKMAGFWIAALGCGAMSLPRAVELEGFDQPLSPPSPNESNP